MLSLIGNTAIKHQKGHVRLSLKGDNSKFLLFVITTINNLAMVLIVDYK